MSGPLAFGNRRRTGSRNNFALHSTWLLTVCQDGTAVPPQKNYIREAVGWTYVLDPWYSLEISKRWSHFCQLCQLLTALRGRTFCLLAQDEVDQRAALKILIPRNNAERMQSRELDA
jgi:hypothetical protein